MADVEVVALGLQQAQGGPAEAVALAGDPQLQAAVVAEALLAPARRNLEPARPAEDLQHPARLQRRGRRQAAHGLPDPGRALGGEGGRFLQPAGRGGGGDDLPAGRVDAQADPSRPAVHLQAHGAAGHLEGVSGGVAL